MNTRNYTGILVSAFVVVNPAPGLSETCPVQQVTKLVNEAASKAGTHEYAYTFGGVPHYFAEVLDTLNRNLDPRVSGNCSFDVRTKIRVREIYTLLSSKILQAQYHFKFAYDDELREICVENRNGIGASQPPMPLRRRICVSYEY